MNKGTTRICLSMIVRNEAAIIERCLRSATPLLDAAVIVDTGSSDGTAQIARAYLDEQGCPSSIASHPWRNFAVNRQAAIEAARSFVTNLGWHLEHTYWLFLDADFELAIGPDFDRSGLRADAILLRQRTGSLLYWNLRLARASLDWTVIGPTHEHYACPEAHIKERLPGLWIHDHGDGGSKADKFPRDIALLTKQMEQYPEDSRALFYLAQSYRAVGDPIKALVLYRKRIALGDASEEVWYSKYRVGRLLAEGGSSAAAAEALLEAHAADPARAEPLYELARLHRVNGQRQKAAVFADRGLQLPIPTERNLFVHTDVYEHKLDLELAQSAWRTDLETRGVGACERLVLSRATPGPVADEARLAALAYAAPLGGCHFLPVRPRIAPPYRPCNPSILRDADGFLVNCRAVNYEQRRLRYRPLDTDGVYRTTNVLMRLDRAFNLVSEREIVDVEPPPRETTVRGFEDVRLFQSGDALMMLCCTTDRHPSGLVHQSVCRLADGRAIAHRPLVGPFDDRPQKNWLPYVEPDGGVRAIFGYDPLTVLAIDVERGSYRVERTCESPLDARGWRGSAGPIPWPHQNGGHRVILIHEAIHRQGGDGVWERVYLHRFVEYDASFGLTRLTRSFVFAHHGVEFACGMTTTSEGDVVVAFGLEDREAYLCRIPAARLDTMLDEGGGGLLARSSNRTSFAGGVACRT